MDGRGILLGPDLLGVSRRKRRSASTPRAFSAFDGGHGPLQRTQNVRCANHWWQPRSSGTYHGEQRLGTGGVEHADDDVRRVASYLCEGARPGRLVVAPHRVHPRRGLAHAVDVCTAVPECGLHERRLRRVVRPLPRRGPAALRPPVRRPAVRIRWVQRRMRRLLEDHFVLAGGPLCRRCLQVALRRARVRPRCLPGDLRDLCRWVRVQRRRPLRR